MPLRPHLGRLSPREAGALLLGMANVAKLQVLQGTPGLLASGALYPDAHGRRRVVYDANDPSERWQSLRELWASGRGDCEDLAAAVAGELVAMGQPARPAILRTGRRGLYHAIVVLPDGRRLDPSRLAGMGE